MEHVIASLGVILSFVIFYFIGKKIGSGEDFLDNILKGIMIICLVLLYLFVLGGTAFAIYIGILELI